jgi:hypothetical protein
MSNINEQWESIRQVLIGVVYATTYYVAVDKIASDMGVNTTSNTYSRFRDVVVAAMVNDERTKKLIENMSGMQLP